MSGLFSLSTPLSLSRYVTAIWHLGSLILRYLKSVIRVKEKRLRELVNCLFPSRKRCLPWLKTMRGSLTPVTHCVSHLVLHLDKAKFIPILFPINLLTSTFGSIFPLHISDFLTHSQLNLLRQKDFWKCTVTARYKVDLCSNLTTPGFLKLKNILRCCLDKLQHKAPNFPFPSFFPFHVFFRGSFH